jgi:16S rRNA (adenine1518-N6/adenine1519-N6)-dimethyltransferase
MLRSGLTVLGDAHALLAAAQLEPEARAETIPVEGYLRLASAWRGQTS